MKIYLLKNLKAKVHFNSDILSEIRLFTEIVNLVLSIFVNPKLSLSIQLSNLACLSHLLLYVFRKHKTKYITNDLYHDLQSTVQDAFISTAIYQKKFSQKPLYLYQLGTDQLESLFSSVRTLTHSRNCDILELLDRLKISLQIEKVYSQNPWRSDCRLSFEKIAPTLDHCSVNEWLGDLSLDNFEIKYIWNYGFDSAREILINFCYTEEDFELQNENITMLNPFETADDDLQDYLLFDENPSNCFVELKGGRVHKANAVNSVLNNNTKLTNDRVIRVRS
ncbi:unnamed protein product [Brachionus calyciflorus]|uniref:Uncharacterized protein n=1 Tax=Brachionus calyciflorus TaxID=104777 RepID=A0A813ZQY9_9BILA|nr:unnamed protein product [Brachionus calyciflorus]